MDSPPCAGLTSWFFPDLEAGEVEPLEARRLCHTCPYRKECAAQGLRVDDRHSYRAGVRCWKASSRRYLQEIADG